MGDDVIVTSDLAKHYGAGVRAVDGLDLRVRRGEVYGFLGRNGAGKTTTMRMLLGLVRPTDGTATVMSHPPGHPAGLAQIGALVETPTFYPYLSGRQNLRVLCHYAGVDPRVIDEVLTEVGLTERADEKVRGYSLGMRQRLGVAAALLKRPALLILDEPTNGLDPQGMATMRHFIRDLAAGDRTVLVSSHLLAEVEQTCDRVGVIDHGRLVAEGTFDELRGDAVLSLRVSPAQQARDLLAPIVGADAMLLDGDVLRVRVDPGRSAELNRHLVQGGIDVFEITVQQRTLEDIFLGITGVGSALS